MFVRTPVPITPRPVATIETGTFHEFRAALTVFSDFLTWRVVRRGLADRKRYITRSRGLKRQPSVVQSAPEFMKRALDIFHFQFIDLDYLFRLEAEQANNGSWDASGPKQIGNSSRTRQVIVSKDVCSVETVDRSEIFGL